MFIKADYDWNRVEILIFNIKINLHKFYKISFVNLMMQVFV